MNVQKILQDEDKLGESGIDGNYLVEELKHLGVFLKNSEIKTPVQTLQLISKSNMMDCFLIYGLH